MVDVVFVRQILYLTLTDLHMVLSYGQKRGNIMVAK